MRIARSLIIVGALAAAGPLAAAAVGDDLQDLRGYLAFPPDWDANDSRRGDDSISGGVRVGVEYVRNFTPIDDRIGGWIWGVEGSITRFDHHDVDGTIVAVTGQVGYAYRLPPERHVHFEGAPFLGVGFADTSVHGDGNTDGYIEVGLRAGAYWTFDSGWQAGFELRFQHADAGDVDQDGVMPVFVGGYRFR